MNDRSDEVIVVDATVVATVDDAAVVATVDDESRIQFYEYNDNDPPLLHSYHSNEIFKVEICKLVCYTISLIFIIICTVIAATRGCIFNCKD